MLELETKNHLSTFIKSLKNPTLIEKQNSLNGKCILVICLLHWSFKIYPTQISQCSIKNGQNVDFEKALCIV